MLLDRLWPISEGEIAWHCEGKSCSRTQKLAGPGDRLYTRRLHYGADNALRAELIERQQPLPACDQLSKDARQSGDIFSFAPHHVVALERHYNAEEKCESEIVDFGDGLRLKRIYWPDGQTIREECVQRNNINDGPFCRYDAQGALEEVGFFSEGKQHGETLCLVDKNKPVRQRWSHGQQQGWQDTLSSNGRHVVTRDYYVAGLCIDWHALEGESGNAALALTNSASLQADARDTQVKTELANPLLAVQDREYLGRPCDIVPELKQLRRNCAFLSCEMLQPN